MGGIQVPHTLKNYNLFVDGRGYAGRVDEISLPKMSVKMEEHRAGGFDTPIQMDMGMEKMEAEFTLSEMNPDVLDLVAVFNAGETSVVARGALHDDSSPGAVWPVVATMRGTIKETDGGAWKAGDKTAQKFTVALRYYKLEVDSKEIFEVDTMNLIRRVKGVDQVEAIRSAIGL